ncbi:unknown [Clostridium sp. CAG:242]|nr:unknown [Clostridium sp. CAG:242]
MAQNKKHRNLIAGILLLLLIGCVVGVFLISFLNKGDEKQRITEQESMQTENSYHGIENFVALNIPYEESSVMPYAENKEVKLGKDLLNDALISEIKKINPDFETEYYSVVYNPSTGLLFLSKVIPTKYGNVFLGVGYTIYIENGMALELTYTDTPIQKKWNQEETLSERIRVFVESGGEKVQLPDIPNALVEVDEDQIFYSYDYETDELTYTVGYEVTHLDEDGAMSAHDIVVQVP